MVNKSVVGKVNRLLLKGLYWIGRSAPNSNIYLTNNLHEGAALQLLKSIDEVMLLSNQNDICDWGRL